MNQVLFFADDNGEDNQLDVALVALFGRDLTPAELSDLGGYGHHVPGSAQLQMAPYLQAPTESSIYVCWHGDAGDGSTVEYGLDETLGSTAAGDSHDFGGGVIWHWVRLTGLEPETDYYYRCRTDTLVSDIHVLRTLPPPEAGDRIIRFAIYGDTRTDADKHAEVVRALCDKAGEIYGEDLHRQLDVVMNVGDIVTDGRVLAQYSREFFTPLAPLSSRVPVMVSIGNHELEASHFYDYMKYGDMQGFQGQGYYSFRIGAVLFIVMNSNVQGQAQLDWLTALLESAAADPQVAWIFAFLHHPGRSEIWPDGNTAWVQNRIIPLLAGQEKVELLSYGHSHNYERGAAFTGNLRLMLSGGGGSALDRWGMYPNQADYPEIHRSRDHYCYTLLEVDCGAGSYIARTFSLGNTDTPLDNVLIDSFTRDRNSPVPDTPAGLAPAGQASAPITLVASPYSAACPIMSVQFQVTAGRDDDWSAPLVDDHRDWENVFGDTGPPDFTPVDLNETVDLTRLVLAEEVLEPGGTYLWRVRYRDRNLAWSDWSGATEFTVGSPAGAPQTGGGSFLVGQNYPNPFNPVTTVRFRIPETSLVKVDIFDIRGRLVRSFDLGRREAGPHSLVWDGTDGRGQAVASGTYFYRVSAGGFSRTLKAVLAR